MSPKRYKRSTDAIIFIFHLLNRENNVFGGMEVYDKRFTLFFYVVLFEKQTPFKIYEVDKGMVHKISK